MRRKLIALCALPPTFVLGICAQIIWLSAPVSGPYEPDRLRGAVSRDYDLNGFYYPAPEFRWMFDDVIRIDLRTVPSSVNSDSITSTPTALDGFLVTNFDMYKLSGVIIDGNRLSFKTEPRAGVSYQFAGRILEEGHYRIKGYSHTYVARTIMVEGRIVKMLLGLKIGESEMRVTKGFGC